MPVERKIASIVFLFVATTAGVSYGQQPATAQDDDLAAALLLPLVASIERCKAIAPGEAIKIDAAYSSLQSRWPNAVSLLTSQKGWREGLEQMKRDAANAKEFTPEHCGYLPRILDSFTLEAVRAAGQVQIPPGRH